MKMNNGRAGKVFIKIYMKTKKRRRESTVASVGYPSLFWGASGRTTIKFDGGKVVIPYMLKENTAVYLVFYEK